jgi:hypothetical protein
MEMHSGPPRQSKKGQRKGNRRIPDPVKSRTYLRPGLRRSLAFQRSLWSTS